jgi:hypothetical protein
MKLLLSLVVLTEIRVLISEGVELGNEGIQNFLFVIKTIEICQVFTLELGRKMEGALTVGAYSMEDTLHLLLETSRDLLPHLYKYGTEILINIVGGENCR